MKTGERFRRNPMSGSVPDFAPERPKAMRGVEGALSQNKIQPPAGRNEGLLIWHCGPAWPMIKPNPVSYMPKCKENRMSDPLTIVVDKEPIQFTGDGKVVVLDAIGALCGPEDKTELWTRLLDKRPELRGLCEHHRFSRNGSALVTDGEGWDKIQSALFDLVLELE
ncbi:hypothetical protein [Desulfatitalea alkaliphila]|uniref:Uncharacterized protein n=1 Tax=Desulfatitalea alkaliphila TaxID=2929485 RepID=A0AA41R1I9_9BACT|nr:hypothetical protein [Desulfatitalea alkaliphila]MCJ8499040.1 hypothetical protein [Desulfatitalea alkaliphila]